MTSVGAAAGSGIVASLARPGGNVTGDTLYVTELVPKRLELLEDAIPRVRRVAVPRGAAPGDIPIERPTKFEFVINTKTARTLGLRLATTVRMRADREID